MDIPSGKQTKYTTGDYHIYIYHDVCQLFSIGIYTTTDTHHITVASLVKQLIIGSSSAFLCHRSRSKPDMILSVSHISTLQIPYKDTTNIYKCSIFVRKLLLNLDFGMFHYGFYVIFQ